MAQPKTVTLSPEANTAVEQIAKGLNMSFDDALGRAIWTQARIVEETKKGKTVTIGRDSETLNFKSFGGAETRSD